MPIVISGTNGISGVDGTASNPSYEGTDANTGVFFPAADTVAIATGGTEALRVNSSQNVGIGGSPSAYSHGGNNKVLEVRNTNTTVNSQSHFIASSDWNGTDASSVGSISWAMPSISATNKLVGYVGGVTESGHTSASPKFSIVFGTNSGTAPIERARFNPTGALVFAGGDAAANGTGITFPATQSASSNANTLDDYEEGTFTPTITGTSTSGTGTYSIQYGSYTKIGNKVYFIIQLSWSAHTGTGNMRVSNLPFTSTGVANNVPCFSFYTNGLALTAGNTIQGYLVPNSAVITLEQVPTGGGASTQVAMDASVAAFLVTGFYDV